METATYKGEKFVTQKGQHGLLNVLQYRKTTLECKHHRPKLRFDCNLALDIPEAATLLHIMPCPTCKRFGGLSLIKQYPKVVYECPVYGVKE